MSEKFGRVDLDYTPVCSAPLPKEKSGDQGCIPRVTKAVKGILERDKNAENIVLVAHGASIGAVHSALGYDYCYVGQAKKVLSALLYPVFRQQSPSSRRIHIISLD